MLHAKPGLFGERHEQLRQPLRQPLDAVDDGVLAAKDVADVFVGLGIEADAVREDALLVEFFHRLARIFDQQALVMGIDVGRHAVGEYEHEFLVGRTRAEVMRGVAHRGAHAG